MKNTYELTEENFIKLVEENKMLKSDNLLLKNKLENLEKLYEETNSIKGKIINTGIEKGQLNIYDYENEERDKYE